MLVIRDAQMNAFEQGRWEALAHRLEEHLRSALPRDYERLGGSAVRALAESAIDRGRKYRMVTELDFFRLFNVMFLLGGELERDPSLAKVLADPDIQPAAKLEFLEQECRDRGKWA
jgi:hypothetical protein